MTRFQLLIAIPSKKCQYLVSLNVSAKRGWREALRESQLPLSDRYGGVVIDKQIKKKDKDHSSHASQARLGLFRWGFPRVRLKYFLFFLIFNFNC